MPPETCLSLSRAKNPPHALVLSQVERILAHESFSDHPKLPELLRYLVEIDRRGRFDPPFSTDKPKPIGKLIVDEFYRDCFLDDQPRDTGPSGKKLVGQLRKKLKAYYGEHPTPKIHGHVKNQNSRRAGNFIQASNQMAG